MRDSDPNSGSAAGIARTPTSSVDGSRRLVEGSSPRAIVGIRSSQHKSKHSDDAVQGNYAMTFVALAEKPKAAPEVESGDSDIEQ